MLHPIAHKVITCAMGFPSEIFTFQTNVACYLWNDLHISLFSIDILLNRLKHDLKHLSRLSRDAMQTFINSKTQLVENLQS